MFNKITSYSLSRGDISIVSSDILDKTAAAIPFPEGHSFDPSFLYLVVKGVSAGEWWGPNKNADFFPESELLTGYKTFLQAHAFKNHENKNVENAIGDVLNAVWDDRMKHVSLLIRIDRSLAPSIVKGFEKGFMTDVSMGCRIDYSVCSICGNKAKTQKEYCEHIRTMKNQILKDGRRVYELNIGPKFHDISAVLNGADRTAKVNMIYINGNKIASVNFEDDKLEKIASVNNFPFSTPIVESANFNEKLASAFESKKPATKQQEMQKIAEIKKYIQGQVIGIANNDFVDNAFKGVDQLSGLVKLLYTKYWDEDKCKEVANNIYSIANERGIPLTNAFEMFCSVIELAGIELSSLEYSNIVSNLIGDDGYHRAINRPIEDIADSVRSENIESILEKGDTNIAMNTSNPDIKKSIRVIMVGSWPGRRNTLDGLRPDDLISVLSRSLRPEPSVNDEVAKRRMLLSLRGDLPERSFHREFMGPRIVRIIKGEEPSFSNVKHFIMPAIENTNEAGFPIASMLNSYMNYQNNRMKIAFSEDYVDEIEKYASEIFGEETVFSKQANILGDGYTNRKAIAYGLPLTFGYSAMQRSRVKNGENVSSFNRYIAENPGNAYVIQALGPTAISSMKKIVPKMSEAAARKRKLAMKLMKKADEDFYTDLVMDKTAAYGSDQAFNFNDVDIFNSEELDSMLKVSYSDEEIGAIKLATVLYGSDREDLSSNHLHKNGLSEKDVNNYLKIATDYLTIEIEKRASEMGDVALSASQDVLFNPKRVSTLALGPGNVIDGIILNKLTKKLTSGAKETNKKVLQKEVNFNGSNT